MEASRKGIASKLIALVCAVTLSLTAFAPSAFADEPTWDPPTAPMETTDDQGREYVTSSAKRIVESYADMLGISNVTWVSNAANPVDLSGDDASDLAVLSSTARAGVFGTNVNVNPNPWVWNLFYNAYAGVNGLEKVTDYQKYIMLDPAGSGPSGADTTVVSEYGTSKTLAMRPDILLGINGENGNGYLPLVAEINSWEPGDPFYQEGDEDYSPKYVSPTMGSMVDGAQTMYALADAANEVIAESNGTKTTRYGDPEEIAQKYETYMVASQNYVLSKIADGTIERKTVGFVRKVDTDTNTITFLATGASNDNSNYRGPEALQAVTDNIIAVRGYEADPTTMEYVGTAEDAMACDVLVICTDNTDHGAGDNVSADQWTSLLKTVLSSNGFTDQNAYPDIFTNTPKCVLNVQRLAADNAQNYGIYLGFVYPEVLNPVEMLAYFYENFYHVKSSELQSTMNKNMEFMSLPSGVTLDISGYSAEALEAKFAEGLQFYVDNKAYLDSLDLGLTPSDRIELPEASDEANPYIDVDPSGWYIDGVMALTDAGVMGGYDGSTFGVGKSMTRAEVAVILWRLAEPEQAAAYSESVQAATVNETGMPDVESGQWYTAAANWAVKNKVINGSDGLFLPSNPIPFEQIIAIIGNYANASDGSASALGAFEDAASVSDWAQGKMAWAVQSGLVNGYDNGDGTRSLAPLESVLRERGASLIYNAMQAGVL